MLKGPYDPNVGNLSFFFNLYDVKEKLKSKAIANYEKRNFRNEYSLTSPTDYYINRWYHIRTLNIMMESYLDIPSNTAKEWMLLRNSVVVPDIEAVGRYAALYAWCNISYEEQWENMSTTSSATESIIQKERDKFVTLNHGLITRCYVPVYRAAQYLSGWTTLEEDMDLPDSKKEPVHSIIMKEIYGYFTRHTKQQIDEELNKLSMITTSEDYNS